MAFLARLAGRSTFRDVDALREKWPSESDTAGALSFALASEVGKALASLAAAQRQLTHAEARRLADAARQLVMARLDWVHAPPSLAARDMAARHKLYGVAFCATMDVLNGASQYPAKLRAQAARMRYGDFLWAYRQARGILEAERDRALAEFQRALGVD